MSGVKYKRILLKISGEALMGDASFGIVPEVINKVAEDIFEVDHLGVEVAVVIGGGNIFRGMLARQESSSSPLLGSGSAGSFIVSEKPSPSVVECQLSL